MMAISKDQANGILRLTGGDEAEARRMRANLAVVARQADDPALRALIGKVLDGQADVRAVIIAPAFQRLADARFDNLMTGLEQLPAAEQQRLRDEALAGRLTRTDPDTLDALRDGLPVPDTSHDAANDDDDDAEFDAPLRRFPREALRAPDTSNDASNDDDDDDDEFDAPLRGFPDERRGAP